MDVKFQPSYMPKQPIVPAPRLVGHISILYVIATVVFVVVLGLIAAVFIAERSLKKDLARLDQELINARNSFELDTIAELKRVSARTAIAGDLLNQHVAVSKFLEALEISTYANVSFSSLSMQTSGSQTVDISLEGMAGSYNTIILQADLFKNVPFLTAPKFSSFSLDERGNVGFTFSASVDPKLVDYKRYVTEN